MFTKPFRLSWEGSSSTTSTISAVHGRCTWRRKRPTGRIWRTWGSSMCATAGGRWRLHVHRSEEHTSELQSHLNLVCRLLLEKKKNNTNNRSPFTRIVHICNVLLDDVETP